MHIKIRGGSKSQKKYVRSIAEYCGEKLLGTKLYPKLELDIQLVPKLMDKENVYGEAWPEDDERRPKTFGIRADSSLRLRRLLETIAHEMVHVKQYAKDELFEYTAQRKGHRFNGKFYSEKTDYWDEPWEIEAHGRELGLFIRWAEKEGVANQQWTQDS